MSGKTDDEVETGDQHPIDRRPRADQRAVVVADEGEDHRDGKNAEKRRELRQHRTKGARLASCGSGGDCGHHTLRAVAAPNRPCGAASRTTMNSVNTATDEKMPPARKFAACLNRPSARPPMMAPRLLPRPPRATGPKT